MERILKVNGLASLKLLHKLQLFRGNLFKDSYVYLVVRYLKV